VSQRAVAREKEATPLVEAKLLTPRLRGDLIDRPRIQRALEQGDGASVTLVAAPPGYGKTTAVRAWCASRPEAFAWVTLDTSDNDPVRLWSYIATAVDRVRGGLGRNALRRLGLPSGRIEDPVIELMNGLATFKSELTVVLDDLQSVTDFDCIESLDYAVDNLPATARLIVVTRTDPALGLPQRRARGDLAELRTSELAFTAEEAYELIVERGRVPLDTHEVETLCERTEGWPAALYLALLWLRQLDDPHRAVRQFGGDHRFVADYLNHEVLGSLDEDARRFLLHTSVLGQFTIDLCEAVLERDDAASVLRDLERSNLFVARLEHGGWFRVHSLFGEFAGFQLAAQEPGTVADIHRRAAEWFRSRGLGIEAVEHAAAAGDHRLVAEILVEHHLPLIRSGGARTLLRWVRTLPEQQLLDHPELAVAAATAGGLVGSGAIEQRRLLQVARRAQLERPQRYTPYVDAGVAMVRAFTIDGGVSAAVVEGRRAAEIAEDCVDDVLVASLAGYSRALYFAGEVVEAEAVAFRAVEHPEAERRPTAQAVARATLALLALDEGHLAAARTHAEKARALIAGIRSSRSWVGANASAALGAVLGGEGKLAEAERELMYAEHFFRDEVPTVHHAWLLLLIARVRCRRGRLAEGEAALASAREQLDALDDGGRVPALAADVERELELAASRVAGGQLLEQPSEAELGVLERLATDLSVREIGNALFISHNTVRTHTRALYRKLGVNSRADAVARATGLGLLSADD
jgi:LuxR family maltose regulon positive regulatory protein